MPRKKLSDQDKYQAVMDLLSGRGTHAEICNRHGISQTYLYKLRDRVLETRRWLRILKKRFLTQNGA